MCALYNPFYEKPADEEHNDAASSDNSTNVISGDQAGDYHKPMDIKRSLASSTAVVNKMVTRKRGQHKAGTHLHLSESRSRSLSKNSEKVDEDAEKYSSNIIPFQCAICKLKAAVNKTKRGKRGAPGGQDEANKKGKGSQKRPKLSPTKEGAAYEIDQSISCAESVPMSLPHPVIHVKSEDDEKMPGEKMQGSDIEDGIEPEHEETITARENSADSMCVVSATEPIVNITVADSTRKDSTDTADRPIISDGDSGIGDGQLRLTSNDNEKAKMEIDDDVEAEKSGSNHESLSESLPTLVKEEDVELEKSVTNNEPHDDSVSVPAPSQVDTTAHLSPPLPQTDCPVKQEPIASHCELNSPSKPSGWRASSLARTKLSDFIEAMVRYRLRQCYSTDDSSSTATDEESNQSQADNIMDSLTIRVVANASRSMDVPDIISDNLPTREGNRVPPYFVYRQKCILLFQRIDGIDVCLFCLYVQEFDESCPEPNKSRVYIAYLDSVEYFRPRRLRTDVYYEIIISYLKWAQTRGFKYGHIWACPPQRGDNFIFWCHPSQQRTPSRDRLTSWYNAMLSRAKTLGICSSIKNLWSCFFEGYGKRDDGLQRQASKNSYVGKQHNTIKSSKQSKKTVPKAPLKCDPSEIPVPKGGDEVPVCPPVFEGDFWVTECTRVYRLVHSRTQGIRYDKDKTLNQRKCREALKSIMTKPIAFAFNQPVDPILLNIPDYTTVIKKPMDFGTVRDKLRAGSYRSMLDFAQDMRLTCNNAMTYNPATHVIHAHAKQLLADFEQMMMDMVTERVGDLLATSQDVDTWLATYPVNSAMEKEDKKRRQKEQQRQRQLIAGKQNAAGSIIPFGAQSTEVQTNVSSVTRPESGPTTDQALFAEVAELMEVDETDQTKLDSLLVDPSSETQTHASSTHTIEPLHSTLCDTRRVFFSSPTEQHIDGSADKPEQRSDVGSDGYGFMDFESSETGQSDNESRSAGHSDGHESVDNDSARDMPRGVDDSGDVNEANTTSSSGLPPYSTLSTLTEDSELFVRPSFNEEDTAGTSVTMPSISRLDSMESVLSVAERWPRRPDRTSSMCVEESMEITSLGQMQSSSINIAPVLSTPTLNSNAGGLTIDIGATHAVSQKLAASSVGRKNSLNANIPFDKPQLGIKGAQALMSELSRNVCRLKDDMYVLMFTPAFSSKGKFDEELTTSSSSNSGIKSEGISQECLLMLQGIEPDTSDPDLPIRSPFIESRQTFLEMCQFRHLQFDCLRRAKYSSSLLIFHLLFPNIESTRPHCHECNRQIKNVRWHCDSCHAFPDFELCNSCKFSAHREPHVHEDKLTPVRVSYV